MVARFAFAVCLLLIFAPFGVDSQQATSTPLKAHLHSGEERRLRTIPQSAVVWLFPDGEAVLDRLSTREGWKHPVTPLPTSVEFVRVSDSRRRFTISGAIFGGQLFLFDELLCGENPGVMSELLRITGTFPRNADDALNLAKIYLSLSVYDFVDPQSLIVSRQDGVPPLTAKIPAKSVYDVSGILHSPEVVSRDSGFDISLFTQDPGSFRVHAWTIAISGAQFGPVRDQVDWPHCTRNCRAYTATSSDSPHGPSDKIEFQIALMANGFTTDGATTDLKKWVASNGPGASRTHYYYASHDKAEARMQDFLGNAISVVDTGLWLDSKGSVVGKKATVVLADTDKRKIQAALLYEDDKSVLEISSRCLRNLLSTQE
jgi:hypothetical protein